MRLRKQQRLALVLLALLLIGGATGLVLAALQDKVAFFVSPSDVAAQRLDAGKRFRLGGLVVEGSIRREADGAVRFALTDTAHEIQVVYHGLLPDLFRDGQGVVAQGTLRADGTFEAAEVLAKHDESYMPKEVADALKQAGYWKEGEEGGHGAPP
jgi:cytochrome c-type biogenesis protein CcmE